MAWTLVASIRGSAKKLYRISVEAGDDPSRGRWGCSCPAWVTWRGAKVSLKVGAINFADRPTVHTCKHIDEVVRTLAWVFGHWPFSHHRGFVGWPTMFDLPPIETMRALMEAGSMSRFTPHTIARMASALSGEDLERHDGPSSVGSVVLRGLV